MSSRSTTCEPPVKSVTCKYYPIINMDEYINEKQVTMKEVVMINKLIPFQVMYDKCVHNDKGIMIKYYSDEYGYITVKRDFICSACLIE